MLLSRTHPTTSVHLVEEEKEEEGSFHDTIEGPRASAVKPGLITQV